MSAAAAAKEKGAGGELQRHTHTRAPLARSVADGATSQATD